MSRNLWHVWENANQARLVKSLERKDRYYEGLTLTQAQQPENKYNKWLYPKRTQEDWSLRFNSQGQKYDGTRRAGVVREGFTTDEITNDEERSKQQIHPHTDERRNYSITTCRKGRITESKHRFTWASSISKINFQPTWWIDARVLSKILKSNMICTILQKKNSV